MANLWMQALKQLGVPGDAWYVTLHVREPGFRGPEGTTEDWRNANPLDYIKAINAVSKAGGWVFRMGDPSMTPLPKIPQVIDYALNEIRCDWMDVFLGATCKFLIGTGSGYYHIPAFFGVPCIMTNFPGFVPYYEMKNFDLYLPRWLKKVQTEKLVSFEDYMSPPTSMLCSMKGFREAGLDWVENTPAVVHSQTYSAYPYTIRATGKYFLENVIGRDEEPLSTLDAAVTCMKIIEACETSVEEERHVTIE